jgi:hypothetical protein
MATWGFARRASARALVVASVLAALAADAAAQVTRVSVGTDGAQANDSSYPLAQSADGRVVLFHTNAATFGRPGSYVRDLIASTTTPIDVPLNATPIQLSDDGRFVAFVTSEVRVPGDTVLCPVPNFPSLSCDDAYVYDRVQNAYSLVSVSSAGTPGNLYTTSVSISGDGRYVAFASDASNLVSDDTNGLPDIFVRDRQTGTTTRVNVGPSGMQAAGSSMGARISGDGRYVAFSSSAVNLAPTPPCVPLGFCSRVFIADRETGAVTLVNSPDVSDRSPYGVIDQVGGISRDGSLVAIRRSLTRLLLTPGPAFVINRGSGRATTIAAGSESQYFNLPVLSPSGRHAAITLGFADPVWCRVVDLVTGVSDDLFSSPTGSACTAAGITDTGRLLFGSALSNLATGDTNEQPDVFILNRDEDGDGMLSSWETLFGLSPTSAADAAVDSDGDGLSNLAEFQSGGHPTGAVSRYFAEGAANAFFSMSLDLYNPGSTPAAVVLHALGENLESTHLTLQLAPGVHRWIRPGAVSGAGAIGWAVPANSFAVTLEADHLVVMEREMTWSGDDAYGSHGETALESPSQTWHFAEGATHGGFDLFYLLQNPGSTAAAVAITYLRPAPLAPLVRNYTVLPRSRLTIYVDQEPGLAATDVSAIVQSDQPLLAERAMYFSTPSQPFAAGAASAGVAAPALEWFLGEGATGAFFDCYILLANPSATTAAAVDIDYLLADGSSLTKSYTVAAQSRLTISVDDEDARLAQTSVSAAVRSTNGVGIVVERAMWWPSGQWYEGHSATGLTQTGTRWAVAGASIDFSLAADTYLAIGNPGATSGQARIRLNAVGQSESVTCDQTVAVPAHGRTTVSVRALCGATTTTALRFSGMVESDGVGLVIERSTYSNDAHGVLWSMGSSLALTRLP